MLISRLSTYVGSTQKAPPKARDGARGLLRCRVAALLRVGVHDYLRARGKSRTTKVA